MACSLTAIEELSLELNPLNIGFMKMFDIGYDSATIFALPSLFATCFGFIFCYGRLLYALGQSCMVNPVFGKATAHGTPYVALIGASVLGYVVCVVSYYVPEVRSTVFSLAALCGTTVYISHAVSFIYFRTTFARFDREFRSPLGIPGACVVMLVYGLVIIAVIGFQPTYYGIYSYLVLVLALSLYYFFVARHNQFFSKQEQEILFAGHVAKSKYIYI